MIGKILGHVSWCACRSSDGRDPEEQASTTHARVIGVALNLRNRVDGSPSFVCGHTEPILEPIFVLTTMKGSQKPSDRVWSLLKTLTFDIRHRSTGQDVLEM